MKFRRWLTWGFTVVAAGILLWGMLSGPATELDPLAVGEKIACPQCEGESIAASQTSTARSMMVVVAERIDDGMSERQILDWFAARYGPDIVLEPPLDLGGMALWAVPILMVAGGGLLAVRASKRRGPVEHPKQTGTRGLVTLGVSAILLVGLVFGIGRFVQPRAAGSPVSGILEFDGSQDLDGVTNEEMEEVLEQFADIPEANRMRLALARRYFEAVNYSKAVEHFQMVLGNQPTPVEASEALGRIGWILFANGEAAAAEAAYLQALDALPANGEAQWFYAILLVESDRGAEAVDMLEALLVDSTVPADVRVEVERLLAEAKSA